MQLRSEGPVPKEESKSLQFPKIKRNKKKQDKHADTESETEN